MRAIEDLQETIKVDYYPLMLFIYAFGMILTVILHPRPLPPMLGFVHMHGGDPLMS